MKKIIFLFLLMPTIALAQKTYDVIDTKSIKISEPVIQETVKNIDDLDKEIAQLQSDIAYLQNILDGKLKERKTVDAVLKGEDPEKIDVVGNGGIVTGSLIP
jgi:hypothetical protein